MSDTEYTDEVTCPHCGYKERDSWEFNGDGDGHVFDHECGECGETYEVMVMVSVKYTTQKKEAEI